jgi:hypothetical protein
MTVEEFKEKFERSGESVLMLAHYAVRCEVDDNEFVKAAESALEAEDVFYKLLLKYDVMP